MDKKQQELQAVQVGEALSKYAENGSRFYNMLSKKFNRGAGPKNARRNNLNGERAVNEFLFRLQHCRGSLVPFSEEDRQLILECYLVNPKQREAVKHDLGQLNRRGFCIATAGVATTFMGESFTDFTANEDKDKPPLLKEIASTKKELDYITSDEEKIQHTPKLQSFAATEDNKKYDEELQKALKTLEEAFQNNLKKLKVNLQKNKDILAYRIVGTDAVLLPAILALFYTYGVNQDYRHDHPDHLRHLSEGRETLKIGLNSAAMQVEQGADAYLAALVEAHRRRNSRGRNP